MRDFRAFTWKDAHFRIATSDFAAAREAIVQNRATLEAYILRHPEFRTAMQPVGLLPNAPPVARQMAEAALRTGVGPMAAVAGTMAEAAARAARDAGADEAIVENGGDIYVISPEPVVIGLYGGQYAPAVDRLAFLLTAQDLPLAVCSSSSRMGHSFSYGKCGLATVFGRDAALADAAATLACNLVREQTDLEPVLERIAAIPGVRGVLLALGDRVGLAGRVPPLVPQQDRRYQEKITVHPAARTWPNATGSGAPPSRAPKG